MSSESKKYLSVLIGGTLGCIISALGGAPMSIIFEVWAGVFITIFCLFFITYTEGELGEK